MLGGPAEHMTHPSVALRVLLIIARQECCPILPGLSIFQEKFQKSRFLCGLSWQLSPIL